MTVVVTHSTPADSSFSTEGAAAWNANHTLSGVGTMAEQNANSVAITGGAIDGTAIGFTTASTGKFTDLTDSSLTAGRVTYAGTGGNLTDSASLTFDGTTLTTNQLTANGQAQFGRSSANYFQATGGATTKAIEFRAFGSDTNVAMALRSQGTGAINLAPGSSGVNISNGGTVTALTRTASGSSYTSSPTVAISAPTTAGGVQATATVTIGAATVVVAGGGTGYTVNDVLTISGGTSTSAAQLTVTSVSGGVITGVTFSNNGVYTVAPSNPVSVIGGTGSGATFTLGFVVQNNFTITNAGSGYVEQPTVTFSGGGGSGAAAYATVGSGTVVRSLGSTMSFHSPNGETFRITDNGTTGGAYWAALSGSTQSELRGSNASAGAAITNAGAFPILFRTSISTEQLRVAHTASAVNYVQVTGAATTVAPVMSVQGSDTNIAFNFTSKGNSALNFFTNGSAQRQFRITHTTSAVNFGYVTGSAAGGAVTFGVDALSSDTNIDLALTPKGTGRVQFGTYTATVSSITGYIEIKDSGGTVRRLAVVA